MKKLFALGAALTAIVMGCNTGSKAYQIPRGQDMNIPSCGTVSFDIFVSQGRVDYDQYHLSTTKGAEGYFTIGEALESGNCCLKIGEANQDYVVLVPCSRL